MKCPVCGKDMGEETCVDMHTVGWVCVNHDGYEIRVTKIYWGKII